MVKYRIIAVLVVLNGKIVQSEKFLHTNTIHYNVEIITKSMNDWSVDEIVVLNVSRKENQREFLKVLEKISKKCFVPLSVGGWVNNLQYACNLFNTGADKVVINSCLHTDLELVKQISNKFGKQAIVGSIDYKMYGNKLNVYIDRGRKRLDISPILYAQKISKYVGEIFLTSIDNEGMMNGYDIKTLKKISSKIVNPIIVFGGAYEFEHFYKGIKSGANAVAAANIFHYKEFATILVNKYLKGKKLNVRKLD